MRSFVAVILVGLFVLALFVAGCGESEDAGLVNEKQSTTAPIPSATLTSQATPAESAVPRVGWVAYTDQQAGFSFPHPGDFTLKEDMFDLPGKDGNPAVSLRVLSFSDKSGTPTISIGLVPNPAGLTVEEWVRLYPGWPGDETQATIGGRPGLLFEVNQVGDPVPTVYAISGGYVFSISANVNGAPDRRYPPGLKREQFDQLVSEFRFGQ